MHAILHLVCNNAINQLMTLHSTQALELTRNAGQFKVSLSVSWARMLIAFINKLQVTNAQILFQGREQTVSHWLRLNHRIGFCVVHFFAIGLNFQSCDLSESSMC